MDSLEKFYNELKLLVGKEPIRPFICNGDPLETEVLIVGYNSAVSTNFWKYFNPKKGFDEDKWLEEYIKINGKLSNTRRVIEWIKDELLKHKHDIHLMVTNIYPYPTKQKSGLKNEQKQTKIFDFLIHNIKPKIIVTHGVDATKYINNLQLSTNVINSPKHFAIGFSKESAKKLAESINKYI